MIDNSLIYEKYRKLLEEMLESNELFDKCVVEGLRWDGYNNFQFSEVYSMDELDEICYGMSFSDFLDKIHNNHFSTDDEYFIWDEDGIQSLEDDEAKHDYYTDQTDISELATYLIEKYYHLDLQWIDRTLDEIVSTINNDEGLTDFELNEKYHELCQELGVEV
jgi:hypothetical protein